MSKPEQRSRKIELNAEFVEEIENFLQEYPEVNCNNVSDFIKEAAEIHMQDLKKKYIRVQMDALSFLQEFVTKSRDAHR